MERRHLSVCVYQVYRREQTRVQAKKGTRRIYLELRPVHHQGGKSLERNWQKDLKIIVCLVNLSEVTVKFLLTYFHLSDLFRKVIWRYRSIDRLDLKRDMKSWKMTLTMKLMIEPGVHGWIKKCKNKLESRKNVLNFALVWIKNRKKDVKN